MTDRYGKICIAIEGESASRIYDIIVNSRIYKEFPEDMKLDYRENLLFIEDSWWGYSPFADFVMPFLMGDDYYYLQYLGHLFRWETNDHEGKYFTIPAETDMRVIWNLSLNANSANEATKINEYAKELNKRYNLELDIDGFSGLRFFDWGFLYTDVDEDNLLRAEEMIDEVVAHFPDMKLKFQRSGDETCDRWEKRSKNGVLVEVEPWRVGVHCDKEHFDELLSHSSFIKQQGFDVSCKENEMALYWEYDHSTEESACNDTIVELSKKMPQTTIYSFKHQMKDNVPKIETFCTMNNGLGEWLVDLSLDGMIEYNEYNGYRIYKPRSRWEIIKDPKGCFLQLLDKERRGEDTDGKVYVTLLYSAENKEYNSDDGGFTRYLTCLKPEDKQWLMAADKPIFDYIVLAGMHHDWRGESSALFEYNEDDEKRLFERVSENWLYRGACEQRVSVELLKLTKVDYRSILRNYLEIIRPYPREPDECIVWLRKELDEI